MSGKNGKPNARKKKEKGGARKFVTSAEEMAARDFVEEQRQSARKMRRNEGSEDDEEEEGESEEEDDGLFDRSEATTTEAVAGITLDEKPKKRSGVAGIIKVQNPNLMPKQNKVMKAKDMDGAVEQQLTRRER
jgi:hypothetical protein